MGTERTIIIYGAGAVGGYLGGKLASHATVQGPQVILVGRAPFVRAIRESGLRLNEFDHDTISRPEAVTSIAGLESSRLVILSVRGYDVERSIHDVSAVLAPDGVVVAMQNGVGTEERLSEALGRERVIVGTLTVSAAMTAPGIIVRRSTKGGLALATMDSAPVPGWLVETLTATGLPTIVVDDYRSLRWSKLLLNMLGAASTAILDEHIGTVLANKRVFRLEQLAFREAGRVMDAQGIATVDLPGYPVTQARMVMRLPRAPAQRILAPRIAAARGGHAPTMQADMMRGKSEVSILNGAVAETGHRVHQHTPVNAALTTLVQDLTAHPEHRATFHLNPDALVEYMRDRNVRV